MQDNRKTKEQLVEELKSLRREMTELRRQVQKSKGPQGQGAEWDRTDASLRAVIRERERTENELRESEEKFRQVLESSTDVIYRRNYLTDRYDYMSPSITAILGYSPEEVIPMTWDEVLERVYPDDREDVARKLIGAMTGDPGPHLSEFRLQHKDGTYRWVSDSFVFQKDAQGRPVSRIGSIRDVTEKKAMERELKASEEKFRLIAETIEDVFWMFSPGEGKFRYVSPAFQKISGRSSRALLDSFDELRNIIHPEDWQMFLRHYQSESEGEISALEFRIIRSDGEIRWVNDRGFPFYAEGGALKYIVGVSSDITERKKAEQQLTAYALRLEILNKELQSFSAIASHDLRGPLRKIQAFGEMLETRAGPSLDRTCFDYLKRMQSSARRMDRLLTALLSYSKVISYRKPTVDVGLTKIVQDVLNELDFVIKESNGKISVGDLPIIKADPEQMSQLFQNLIENGLKYRRQNVEPEIEIGSRIMGDHFQIFVKDNGIGFDEAYREKIFQPFERLHSSRSSYKGTGMGLAICRKIVERHGGTITAQAKPGSGTIFVVDLPFSRLGSADDVSVS